MAFLPRTGTYCPIALWECAPPGQHEDTAASQKACFSKTLQHRTELLSLEADIWSLFNRLKCINIQQPITLLLKLLVSKAMMGMEYSTY